MSVNTQNGSKTAWSLRTQGGFIALISAILISVSLLVLVVSVGFGGFFGRFAVLDSEVKEVSNFLAEACVNTAIIEVVQDDEYDGNDEDGNDLVIPVGDEECVIRDVAPTGAVWPKTIEVQAVYKDAHTNLQVTVDDGGAVTDWLEVASF